jgi:hypothetical protein
MKYPIPQQCPVCESKLIVQELKCDHCQTSIKGRFETTRLASLSEEQLRFVEIFLKVRGSIKEMERELNISYPTVRNRLEQVVEVLGYQPQKISVEPSRRQEILNQLDQGEITSEEALKLLNEK